MRAPSRITLGLAAAAVLAAGMAVPANAADTTATVEVPAGTLTLNAPESFELDDVAPGALTRGELTGVSVNDARAGELGWVASVSVGDFTGTKPENVLPSAGTSYMTGKAVVTGKAAVAASNAVGTPGAVQTATAVKGNNTAAWDAVISVETPDDALADTYTATIVHSVV